MISASRLVVFVIIFCHQAGLCSPVFANRVIVRGRRADQSKISYPGSGWRFHANGSSQDDLSNHLKRQASWEIPPSENPAPFGFSLPRIRGQDSRFSLLLVDDLIFADPYSALPLVDELDFPAFDSVESTAGVAPFTIPAIASRGALRFELLPQDTASQPPEQPRDVWTVGARFGEPRASTSWLRFDHINQSSGIASDEIVSARSDFSPYDARIYLRRTESSGDYRYLDDGGTPLTADDDEIRKRVNNDRSSVFFMPAIGWQVLNHDGQAFMIVNEVDRGIPLSTQALNATSQPRQHQRLAAGQISVAKNLGYGEAALRHCLRASVGAINDHRVVEDPTGTLLILSDRDERSIVTRNYTLGWTASQPANSTEWNLQYRKSQAYISGSLLRQTDQVVAASRIFFGRDKPSEVDSKMNEDDAMVEIKAEAISLDGDTNLKLKPGFSLAVNFPKTILAAGESWRFTPYAQFSREYRAPSLLETTGDGALIQGAEHIRPESMKHMEAGFDVNVEGDQTAVHVAIFEDVRRDAIAIVPSSMLHYRAVNLAGESRMTGVELQLEKTVLWSARIGNVPAARVSLAGTWLQSISGSGRLIPGIPSDQGAVSIAQPFWRRPWKSIGLRWTGRRRGRVYRDVANDILLPPWWLHDVALDIKWRFLEGDYLAQFFGKNHDFEAGFGVTNVFDLMAIDYRTSTGARATTGYSDSWGIPLPGRSWVVSLTAKI